MSWGQKDIWNGHEHLNLNLNTRRSEKPWQIPNKVKARDLKRRYKKCRNIECFSAQESCI